MSDQARRYYEETLRLNPNLGARQQDSLRRWVSGSTFRRGPYHALVSPQGHVEYNAEFVVGKAGVATLEPGRWYTEGELAEIAGRRIHLGASPQCVEKNIRKWRYERQ